MHHLFQRHKHIALDLDETLAASILDGLKKMHAQGKMLGIQEFHQLTSFNWLEFPECDLTPEELIRFWRAQDLKDVYPITEAINGVYHLSQKNTVLHIVTARNEHDHKKDTHEWINKFFPEIHPSRIHFANHNSSQNILKSTICKSHGITLMIDDGLHNAEELAENGIECILLDKPWNQKEHLHPHIYRVKDWNEIIYSLQ